MGFNHHEANVRSFARLAAFFVLGVASSAMANYDKTRWGMTLGEVKALYPQGQAGSAAGLAYFVVQAQPSGLVPGGAATFGFDAKGGLETVQLDVEPHDRTNGWPASTTVARTQWDKLRATLREKLGIPQGQTDEAAGKPPGVSWRTPEDDDLMLFLKDDPSEPGRSHVVVMLMQSIGAVLDPMAFRGYDKASWGSSPAEVQHLYPGGSLVRQQNGDLDYNVVRTVNARDNVLSVFTFEGALGLRAVMLIFPALATPVDTKSATYVREDPTAARLTYQGARSSLGLKYGSPSELMPQSSTSAAWLTAGGDLIVLSIQLEQQFATVAVRYEPYRHPQDRGF